jgi:hypothetical protein
MFGVVGCWQHVKNSAFHLNEGGSASPKTMPYHFAEGADKSAAEQPM